MVFTPNQGSSLLLVGVKLVGYAQSLLSQGIQQLLVFVGCDILHHPNGKLKRISTYGAKYYDFLLSVSSQRCRGRIYYDKQKTITNARKLHRADISPK